MTSPPWKRLKVNDITDHKLTWRSNSKFADWTLTWGDDGPTIRVHRFILVEGPRPMHFFAGATHEAYQCATTDLSKLLPVECKKVLENALDFVYGAELQIADADSVLLYKLADVLQCPALQNESVDAMAIASRQAESACPLLTTALSIGLSDLVSVLVTRIPSPALAESAVEIASAGPQVAAQCIQELASRCVEPAWAAGSHVTFDSSSGTASKESHHGSWLISSLFLSESPQRFIIKKTELLQEWYSDCCAFGLVSSDVLQLEECSSSSDEEESESSSQTLKVKVTRRGTEDQGVHACFPRGFGRKLQYIPSTVLSLPVEVFTRDSKLFISLLPLGVAPLTVQCPLPCSLRSGRVAVLLTYSWIQVASDRDRTVSR